MKFTNDIEVAVDSIARWKNGTPKWLAQHWEEIEREMAEDRAARIKPESEAEGE